MYLQRHTNQRQRGEATQRVESLARQQTDLWWTSYNEFLVDAAVWNASLPWAIEAFVAGEHAAAAYKALVAAYFGDGQWRAAHARGAVPPILALTDDVSAPFRDETADQLARHGHAESPSPP